ncbi:MAG TPA: aldolase [Gammaproteobacteria bacterium]|nr:aldolase [Gammaproteobacteria bacterium]
MTIRENRPRPTEAQIKALSGHPTGFLADAMDGTGAMAPEIKSVAPGVLPSNMCGPVLTCDAGPADNMAVLAAITEVASGDIVVSASGNWRQCAVVGDRMMGMLRNAGASGFVTDGLVRDIEGLIPVGLPIFCTGLSPNSPSSKGPGSVGEPVQVGGVTISSGDVLVSDDNGVVIVPFARIDAVIERLETVEKLERGLDANIQAGLAIPDSIRDLVKSSAVKRVR